MRLAAGKATVILTDLEVRVVCLAMSILVGKEVMVLE